MANVGVEDVRRAAAELGEAGEGVSAAKIRGHLGRGSMTTITRLLREIRSREPRRDALPLEMDLATVPKEVSEGLSEAIQIATLAIYKSIAGPINQQISAAREELDVERDGMKQDVAQILAESNDIKELADRQREELARSNEALMTATSELASIKREVELKNAATVADRARHETEVAALREQMSAASTEHRNLQTRLEKVLTEAGELRGRLAAMAPSENAGASRK